MEFNSVSDLLDYIIKEKQLKNDAALSRALEVSPPCISNLRKGTIKLGASYILNIHEYTGLSVKEIKTAVKS
jgi:plasmid maintenance system antidote protein VapI